MAIVKTFKGIRYNPNKIKDLSSVVAPPYDIIPEGMQSRLYRAHPYNIIRLILGKIKRSDDAKDNRYSRAKDFFQSWLKKNILLRDEREAIYIYSQRYTYNGKYIDRIGFISLMKLDTGRGSDKVLPHENTLLAPKLDRLNLIEAVRANLSPIFVLYEDERHRIMSILKEFCSTEKAIIDIGFENIRHRIWMLHDRNYIKRIKDLMRDKDIFIADGHHRYEVARMYSKIIQKKSLPNGLKKNSKFMMVYFVESDEKMLTILPAHRLVKDIGVLKKEDIKERLTKFFNMEKTSGLNKLISRLTAFSDSHAFGLYLGRGDFYMLKLKNIKQSDRAIKDKPRDWKRLDVSILHQFIFQYILEIRDDDNNIEFIKDAREVVRLVDKGMSQIAFFLNPTKAHEVRCVAKLGERMPRKATYFYPKPLSGLVINNLC